MNSRPRVKTILTMANGSSCLQRLSVIRKHCNKILKESTSSYTTRPPLINLSKYDALVDEKICITLEGLQKGQEVTLQTLVKDNSKIFGSCGQYVANEEGKIDLSKDKCHGGTYDGYEPMGLFWSIQSQPGSKPRRILPTDVTVPYTVRLALHSGFKDFTDLPWTEDFPALASCHFKQRFMAPGVRCIHVAEDGILGTLFLPPGEGPFPAVLDVFGMTNMYPGHRSSLLASNGIASFVIAYVGHEGLAKSVQDIQYSYFLKAFDWLSRHPMVNPQAMGGLGSCIGGGYLSLVAWKRPSMKCLVGINTCIRPGGPRQEVEGEVVEEGGWDLSRMVEQDGLILFRYLGSVEDNLRPLPYWRHGVKILYIQGDDDQAVDPDVLTAGHADMPEEFKDNVEFIRYPGAGHIIEPPFMPLCRTNYNNIFKMSFLWGGQPKQHAHAQMDSWPRIVAFIRKHLLQADTGLMQPGSL